MSIDLQSALRKHKPDKHTTQLLQRKPDALVSWTTLVGAAPAVLLLDTNIYIARAAGRIAAPLRAFIDRALLFHCSVALGELATGVAHADPAHPSWRALRDHYVALLAAVPDSRLLTPDPQTWADAGVIAGTLARTQGFQPHQRKECLNDALIFLTAARAGVPVLTADRADFDLIQQLAPEGRFVHT